MSAYRELAWKHMHESGVIAKYGPKSRATWLGGKLHASVMGLIEEKGMSVTDMSRDDIKAWATEKAIAYKSALGIIGWFITQALIGWVVSRVVDRVMDWLIEKLQNWIEHNKSTKQVGYVAVFHDLTPLFADARKVARSA